MPLYTSNIAFQTTNLSIPNVYAKQMEEKQRNKIVFLDVPPKRSGHTKPVSSNAIAPLKNNLVSTEINRDIVYENIKPVITILRLLGGLPLTRPNPGVNLFALTSSSMVYSLIVFCSFVSYVLYLSLHKVEILKKPEGKFEEAVIEYLFTVYLFPLTVIPILWYETRKIAGILNGWVEFEVRVLHRCRGKNIVLIDYRPQRLNYCRLHTNRYPAESFR